MAAASADQNCPSCGAPAPPLLKHSKLAVCAFCNTSIFVEDAAVKTAGEKSVLTEVPSLLEMGRRYHYGNWMFETIGRIRYEYGDGDGYWDEWWALLDSGQTKWVSVDEGEHVIQSEMPPRGDVPEFDAYRVGEQINLFDQMLTVTELNEGTCMGVEGQLPEVIRAGDVHRYAHLEGPKSLLVTAEYDGEATQFFKGLWVDPFEIRSL